MVAQPAERAHRPCEEGPREDERDRKPQRVRRRAGRRPGSRRPTSRRAPGCPRARARCTGAAQTAKAPPRATRDPRQRAPGSEPAPTQPLGPRQQPHECEPEHDEHEAGDPLEQELVLEQAPADERGPHAEQDEDGREAEHERDARDHDPPGRARLHRAGPRSTADTAERYPGTSGRTHGARNEMNPASSATGISEAFTRAPGRRPLPPGRAGLRRRLTRRSDAGLGQRLHDSKRLELRVDALFELGIERSRRSHLAVCPPAAPAPGDQPDPDRPRDEHRERHEPGEQVEPGLGWLRQGRPARTGRRAPP